MKNKKTARLSVVEFTPQGHGLAYHEEKPIEIKNSIPGDEVTVQLLKKRKKLIQTWVEEFHTHSKNRVTPKCAHFAICGGCRWQQMPYDDQLKIKEDSLLKLFASDSKSWLGLIPCKDPWQYRNKMELTFSQNKAEDKFLGLYMQTGKGRVLNIEECHIGRPWFNKALKTLRSWWDSTHLQAFHPPKNTGSLRTVTLREGIHTGDKLVMLTVSGNPSYALPKENLITFCETLKESLGKEVTLYLQIHQAIKGKVTQFYEMHLNGSEWIQEKLTVFNKTFTFNISPTAFFQPNTVQAEKLYETALSFLELSPSETLLDLYCGTGTLGILASPQCKKVVGIELSPQAILDAKDNLHINNIGNMELFQGDVGEVIQRERLFSSSAIIDPPRTGIGLKTLKTLTSLPIKKIAYISCNPKTQVEDIAILKQNGFKIKKIKGIDQFPYTPHIETVVLLTKESDV
jgi:23S rRNA (uracil1939-C5)-methyltransferase